MCVLVQLAVGAEVKEAAGGVVGARAECVAVWEESVLLFGGNDVLDSVDVGFVPGECLHTSTSSDIPDFCSRITRSGHKHVLIRG